MFRWKVDLLDELKKIGWYPRKMRLQRLFGESTIQRMRHQGNLSWAEFDRYCEVVGKQPGDLLEWVPSEKSEEGSSE